MPLSRTARAALSAAALVSLLGGALWVEQPGAESAQESTQTFTIHAHKYAFTPPRLEVRQNDLVTITLVTDDIPHSFTVDGYRIAKRVNPGQTVVFEFRADEAGEFPFYCSLTIDEGCRAMRGTLVVRPR
jgi:nitrous-oxide reductase